MMKIPFNPSEDNPGEQIVYDEDQTAVGLDVDCYTGSFYWTDVFGRTINKAQLDGTEQEIVMRGG